MQAMNARTRTIILNTAATALATLRFASERELQDFASSTPGVEMTLQTGTKTYKRANLELLARNVNGSTTTPHTVLETLYLVRVNNFGDLQGGGSNFFELHRIAELTWSFTAGSGNEIPLSQLPPGSLPRLSASASAGVASSMLLENEINGLVVSTSLGGGGAGVGAIVHVQDLGAGYGILRHFRSMNAALIEGVVPLSQLYDA